MEDCRPMALADPPPQEEGTGLPRDGPVYELLPVEVPRREGRCPPGPRIRRHPARARRRSKGPRFRFTIAGLMILIALLAPAFAHPRAVAELTALTGFVALIVLTPLALTVLISRALGTAARATLALTDAALDEALAWLGRLRRPRSPGRASGSAPGSGGGPAASLAAVGARGWGGRAAGDGAQVFDGREAGPLGKGRQGEIGLDEPLPDAREADAEDLVVDGPPDVPAEGALGGAPGAGRSASAGRNGHALPRPVGPGPGWAGDSTGRTDRKF